MAYSCGDGEDGNDSNRTPQPEDSGPTTFDSQLTPAERSALSSSLDKLETIEINGNRIKGFTKIFGGATSADVINYFNTRVHYFISEATDYTTRLVPASLVPVRRLEVFASNPSVFIWYEAKYNEPEDLRFQLNNEQLEINSSRIGVMQVGDIFNQSDVITQAITLVHEARHSDCTGGALASDIQNFHDNGTIENKKCGYLHGFCPLAGSCDVIPWGAYAIDVIYSLAISETCTSCTEAEKQSAEANALQFINNAYELSATVNGEFGDPDMSSSNTVR